MDLGLSGKVAAVAGGSSGLGLAVARKLHAEGAAVSICARDEGRLQTVARHFQEAPDRFEATALDIRDAVARARWLARTVDHFGALHIVLANSGGPPVGGALEFDLDDYRDAVELNLLSSIGLVTEALPHLQAAGWGRILFLASQSVRQPIPNLALSNTARAGLLGYAKSLVHALGDSRITVNVLAPGIHATPRIQELSPSDIEVLTAGVPLGRAGDPSEFASVAAFLASEPASYVTGAVVPIDGGATGSLM